MTTQEHPVTIIIISNEKLEGKSFLCIFENLKPFIE
jgi:hypothetical protein